MKRSYFNHRNRDLELWLLSRSFSLAFLAVTNIRKINPLKSSRKTTEQVSSSLLIHSIWTSTKGLQWRTSPRPWPAAKRKIIKMLKIWWIILCLRMTKKEFQPLRRIQWEMISKLISTCVIKILLIFKSLGKSKRNLSQLRTSSQKRTWTTCQLELIWRKIWRMTPLNLRLKWGTKMRLKTTISIVSNFPPHYQAEEIKWQWSWKWELVAMTKLTFRLLLT